MFFYYYFICIFHYSESSGGVGTASNVLVHKKFGKQYKIFLAYCISTKILD